MRADGAIILDILNLIGRFFKFGMETKQFPSPDKLGYQTSEVVVSGFTGLLETDHYPKTAMPGALCSSVADRLRPVRDDVPCA